MVAFGPHGAGASVGDDDCACEAAAALDAGDEAERAHARVGDESEDACPFGCDCPCCASPSVSATGWPMSLTPLGSVALAVARDGTRTAPTGTLRGVFRPPRA